MKNTIIRTAFITVAILLLASQRFVFAGPPFIATSSAIPVDTGTYRLEGGWKFSKTPPATRKSDLSATFKYGLINNLEISAKLPYSFVNQNGQSGDQLGDLDVRAKVRFLKGREASPLSVAGQIQVKIPSSSSDTLIGTTGEADVGFMVLATKEVPPYKAHLNIAHTYIGNPANQELPDRRNYSIGVQFTPATPNLTLAGEFYGFETVGAKKKPSQSSIAGGASYQVLPELTLHGMLGLGISSHAPDYTVSLVAGYSLK